MFQRSPFGSSPLARGTHFALSGSFRFLGLIPARAGNTRERWPPASRMRAHPRSRGEQDGVIMQAKAQFGSSPLARGTLVEVSVPAKVLRLIPARAGNTGVEFLRRSVISAHPRSRGEHQAGTCRGFWSQGSSPLARGAPVTRLTRNHNRRLIPARAGNTAHGSGCKGNRRAHPRSRGEHV